MGLADPAQEREVGQQTAPRRTWLLGLAAYWFGLSILWGAITTGGDEDVGPRSALARSC